MAKQSILRDKSFAFAVQIVKLCNYLREEKKDFVLSKQLIRSGTSIGSNIEEAAGAQSDKDFIAKLHIALKESNETRYWIRLLKECQYLSSDESVNLLNNVNEIIALLTSSLKTLKAKCGQV